MHTTTWRARLVLALGILSGVATTAQAAPINYDITFTLTDAGVSLPAAGSFTYDAATPLFTNFHVIWNNQDFDLTAAANNPLSTGGCAGALSGPAGGFAILDGTSACAADQVWAAFTSSFGNASYFYLFGSRNAFAGSVMTLNLDVAINLAVVAPSGPPVIGGGTFTIAPSDVASIPEPASLILLGTGLLAAAATRRSKTR